MIKHLLTLHYNIFKEYVKRNFYNLCVRHPLPYNFAKASAGYFICQQLRKKYGKNAHIFLVRGATGDIYLNGLLLRQFIKKHNITNYVLVGDSKGLVPITQLFEIKRRVPIDYKHTQCIQKAYMLWGGKVLNLTDLFTWQDTLYFNRCRIRMTERFNFMDTYLWYIYNFDQPVSFDVPHFSKLTKKLQKNFRRTGIEQGRTVIMSPFAFSVRSLPNWFWNKLGMELEQRGYRVFINADPVADGPQFEFPCFLSSYKESVPLLEYAGGFVGVRSGFCDIISSAKCTKIILYPKTPKSINYSQHRSDLEFSGLKAMGLANDVIEMTSYLIQDITARGPSESDYEKDYKELRRITDNILEHFKPISVGV